MDKRKRTLYVGEADRSPPHQQGFAGRNNPHQQGFAGQDNRKQLEEAIQLLPHDEKAAYMEAKERCPWLVETDPDPMRFLHYDKFNVWEAAKRLAKYWTLRKELFGARAFLPMHQTGNGTLSDEDLEVFSTGLISCLPDGDSTNKDGYVACYIPSRQTGLESRDTLMRVHFYFHSIMMDLNPVDDPSYTVLVVLNWIGFQRTLGKEREAEVLNHLPLFGKSMFLVQSPDEVDEVGRMTFFQLIVPPILKLANLVQLGGRRAQVIAASSHQDLANQLVAHGFQRENLPPECGGTWTMDQFRQWRCERIELERQREIQYYNMATVAPAQGSMVPTEFAAAAMPDTSERSDSTSDAADESKSEQDRIPAKGTLERKRVLDRLKSKRKRIKRKAKFDALETSCKDVKAEHLRLRDENSRLEDLLGQAKRLVHPHVMQQPKQEYQASSGSYQLRPSSSSFGCPSQQQQPNLHVFDSTATIAPLQQHHQSPMNPPHLSSGSQLNQLDPNTTNLAHLLQQQQQQPPQTLMNNPLLTATGTNFSSMMSNAASTSLQYVLPLTDVAGIQQQPVVGGLSSTAPVSQGPSWWNLFARTSTAASSLPAVQATAAGSVATATVTAAVRPPMDHTRGGLEEELS